MYGLPQACILRNKQQNKHLEKHGYYKVAQTPGLWKHIYCPVQFTLVVDDFGIEYDSEGHPEHLLNTLEENYTFYILWE
ncbi:hypothetical protein ACHAW6_011281 [Cyclotella cf. meneghiniana]